MAKVKQDLNIQYLDASPSDFSQGVRDALAQERAAYEVLKAAKARVLELVRAEAAPAPGQEIKGTAYTRWGQWQIVVGDKVQAKATTRKTLADYMAERQGQGLAS